jgi:hypothetical protein
MSQNPLSRWTLRIGLALIAAALLLLSPVPDFLPVGLWGCVKDLFSESPAQHAYVRVVRSSSSRIVEFSLMGIGILFVAVALYLRSKE